MQKTTKKGKIFKDQS